MFGKSRSAFLVWSIGLLVILGPFISDTESLVGHLVARLLITAVLASGVYAVSRRPSHLRIALVLLILTVIGSVTMMLFPTWPVMVANLAMGALFYLMLCLLLIHHILAARHVTADTIYTSIAAYMMLSATFAVLYLLADALQPGAVTGAIHRHPPLPFSILDALYFSTTVLTSVGFGDILPVSGMARAVSVLEMWVGQLYPAVLIARLVGMYASLQPERDCE